MNQRGIAILGSTGSVGTTALKVIARQTDRFRVVALTAHSNADLLREQVREFTPAYVGLVNCAEARAESWHRGAECLVEAATLEDADIVLNAIVGAAGLDATIAALTAGKRVALAPFFNFTRWGSSRPGPRPPQRLFGWHGHFL